MASSRRLGGAGKTFTCWLPNLQVLQSQRAGGSWLTHFIHFICETRNLYTGGGRNTRSLNLAHLCKIVDERKRQHCKHAVLVHLRTAVPHSASVVCLPSCVASDSGCGVLCHSCHIAPCCLHLLCIYRCDSERWEWSETTGYFAPDWTGEQTPENKPPHKLVKTLIQP